MYALASRFSDIAAVGARLRHFAPELSLFAVKGPPALDSRMTIEAFERRIHGAPAGRAVGGELAASACAGANAAAQMSAASTPHRRAWQSESSANAGTGPRRYAPRLQRKHTGFPG
jgi:hypothetical protein